MYSNIHTQRVSTRTHTRMPSDKGTAKGKSKSDAAAAAAAAKGAKGSKRGIHKLKDKDECKFATYIAKAHKNIHGAERTVSASALGAFDLMTDHLITTFIANGRRAMRYSKTSTFNKGIATGAAAMSMTGLLKSGALAAGDEAVAAFDAFNAAAGAAAAAGGVAVEV